MQLIRWGRAAHHAAIDLVDECRTQIKGHECTTLAGVVLGVQDLVLMEWASSLEHDEALSQRLDAAWVAANFIVFQVQADELEDKVIERSPDRYEEFVAERRRTETGARAHADWYQALDHLRGFAVTLDHLW